MGFSNLVGMGGAPLAAMKLGEGEKHEAEKILGNCIYFYLFLALTLTAVLLIFRRPLLFLFGADEFSKYVAVMSILLIMSQFIYVAPVGMGQGAQPIISYNCGAHKLERVKKPFYLMVTSATVYSFFIVALMEIFAVQLFEVFTNDENLIQIGVPAMFLFLTGRAFNGIQFGMQHFFQAIGDALSSTLVATVRKIVLILPIALILPGLFGLGVNGVFLTESIADVCSAIFSIIMFNIRKKRDYGKCMDKEGVTE